MGIVSGYRLDARRIASLYVLGGLLWIVTTDYIAGAFTNVPLLPMFKGGAFVLVTGALLYLILARAASSIKASQARLVASEERFRKVVENAPVGIFIQTGGRFRYLNAMALRTFGADNADLMLNQSVFDRFHPSVQPVIRERIRQLLDQRTVQPPIEEKWVRLDGTTLQIEVSAVPFDFDGEPGALVFFADIAERLRTAQENRILEEQFRQAQKMESVGRLAGGIAHDFNNLLTVINGYSDLLLSHLPPQHSMYNSLLEINNAGERAVSITRQLLAFSRKDVIEPKVLNVNKVIHEIERMLQRLMGEGIKVTTRLSPNAGLVFSDPGWLTQVLLNLAVNSRDAMAEGGELTLETHSEELTDEDCRSHPDARPGKAVRIAVRDTGCGMDDQTRLRIFEPFFTTKPQGQGTGLGLSIVYGIVKSSGGWIDVESRPLSGTTISIFLPNCEETAEEETTSTDHHILEGSETILLVEDDPTVRGFAESALASYGYDVIPCRNGDDAVQRSAQFKGQIDVLLSDIVMPGLGGIQLATQLLAERPDTKVIFMSGYSRENLGAPSIRSIHTAYVSKPFTAHTLVSTVRSVLDGKAPVR